MAEDWVWSGPGACECTDAQIGRAAKATRARGGTSFECAHGLWIGGSLVTALEPARGEGERGGS